jgi:hypothetical protein
MQKGLIAATVVLLIIFGYELHKSRLADAGPAQLVRDINDHAVGGVARADLEPYLSTRGGDVSYEPTAQAGRNSGVDHAIFRDVRRISNSTEDLHADFFYDQSDHLMYFSMRHVWNKPKH